MRLAVIGACAAAVAVSLGAPAGASTPLVNATCTPAVATVVRPAGDPAAPVLVPGTVPVRLCTVSPGVQVLLPAFQVVGLRPARILVPQGLPAPICTATSTVGQVLLSSPGVVSGQANAGNDVIVSGGTVTATVLVPVVTCF